MSDKIIDIGTIYTGKQISVQIGGVTNNNDSVVEGVYVDITEPEGLTWLSSNIPTDGTYDVVTGRWTVGALLPGQTRAAEFIYEVSDACKSQFEFTFKVDSLGGCGDCIGTKATCHIYKGYSCCDLARCGFTTITTEAIDEACPSPAPVSLTTPPDDPINGNIHIQFYQTCQVWWKYDDTLVDWVLVNPYQF